MKRTRYSEEQIIGVLKEAEAGAKTGELARRHGVSVATIYTGRPSMVALRCRRRSGAFA
jgi:transposase-like protein